MYSELKGKAAFVTGAALATGIGFGIAEQLAANGMDVLLGDLAAQGGPLEENCAALRRDYGVRAEPITLDVSDAESIRAAVENIRAFAPSLRALINNAGINRGGQQDRGVRRRAVEVCA